MFNGSPYAPDKTDGFGGVPISKLAQPESFYEEKHKATLNYLCAVYPLGKDSFNSLDYLELASFFNSLNFYYNCAFQYSDNDLGFLPGKISSTWDAMPCVKTFPLPYTPQGIFYNFYSYQKYNIPTITSDSNDNVDYLQLKNFGACRPGLAFTTFRKGQIGGIRTGPGPEWINCRTIQRHVWNPNGPVNNKKMGDSKDNWSVTLGKYIDWNYPKGWLNGYKDNEYVEITHFFHGPGGVTTSPGYWYNTFSGSGIFVNLGKTFVATNKIGGVFSLAQEMAKTQSGKDFLIKYFNTSDPYMVVYNCQTAKVCSPVAPCLVAGGVDNTKGIPYEFDFPLEMDFEKAIVNYQKSHNISNNNTSTYEGIKSAIDAAINITDYNMFRFGVNVLSDEPMFFMAINLGIDTIQLPCDPNSSGFFVFEIIDMRVPSKYIDKLKNRDYTDAINFIYKGEDNGAMFANTWNSTFLQEGLEFMVNNNIWSNRDPLDIYNNNKAKGCLELLSKDIPFACPNNIDTNDGFGYWYNIFTDNSLSKEYRCLNMGVDASMSPCNFSNNPTC
jgi:hypothetical protein